MRAFEPAPKLHQFAVVLNERRENLWADHGHMPAGVAAEPDVITSDHGVAKGLRRPVTKFGRQPGEGDVPLRVS
jgi:hypothetical protein